MCVGKRERVCVCDCVFVAVLGVGAGVLPVQPVTTNNEKMKK